MSHLFGISLILISAASFGAMPIFAKFAYQYGIGTDSLLFYRFSIAFGILMTIALIQKKKFPKGKDLYIFIGMGLIGYAGQSYSYFTALTKISASLTAILLYTYPVIVAVLSIFFLSERFTLKKFIALCLAVGGTILVIGFQADGDIKGIIWGLTAAVIYSVYIITGARVMTRNDPFTASVVIIGSAAFVYLMSSIKSGLFIPTTGVCWGNIIAIAIISTAIAISTFFAGLNLIGAVNASLLSTFEPVTTMLLAALMFSETIGAVQIAGTVLILISAIVIARNSSKEEKNQKNEKV